MNLSNEILLGLREITYDLDMVIGVYGQFIKEMDQLHWMLAAVWGSFNEES